MTVHEAAEAGLTDELAALLRSDPALVHARGGGDRCTPLHVAKDVATAEVLLEHGAEIDARDEDHDSTPAQWLIKKAPEVTKYLLGRGAKPDIFLASALGDLELATRLVQQNPACVAQRIGKLPEFPPIGHEGRGGTILQWTLAFNSYPHQVALMKGHRTVFDFLYSKSDARTQLLVCCVLGLRKKAQEIVRWHPDIVPSLPSEDLELLPIYCWETNTCYDGVRLMLDLGFPIAHLDPRHGYSALHNAAWSGNTALVELLIERGHPLDLVDPKYNATAVDYAIHDATVEKRHPEGEFAKVVELLLRAGCKCNWRQESTGNAEIDAVLAKYR